MKSSIGCMSVCVALSLSVSNGVKAADMGTEMTYQGRLDDAGVPVNGQVDMRFTLYDAATLGNVVGTTAVFDGQGGNGAAVDVIDGLLTVSPDFGANVFDGTALWLEIEVRNPHDATDTAAYDTLDPRQPITAVPVALQTKGIFVEEPSGNVGIGTTTPATTLEVEGRATVDATGSVQPALTVVGGPGEAAIQIDNGIALWRIWTLNSNLNFTQLSGVTRTPFRIHQDAANESIKGELSQRLGRHRPFGHRQRGHRDDFAERETRSCWDRRHRRHYVPGWNSPNDGGGGWRLHEHAGVRHSWNH